MGWLRLAIKYIAYHKFKSLILIACIFLTAFLPIAIGLLLQQFNQKIVARATETPIVIGAKGSRLDLTLHTLYFKTPIDETIPFSHVRDIRDTEWANPIPVYSKFTAKDFPIVGTNLDYFDFRGLRLEAGNGLVTLGDCVIGSKVWEKTRIGIGETLISDRENLLDIGGSTPLKMHVRGILKTTDTPDDWCVFVDLKTAWIIEGLGHGHQELADVADEESDLKILNRDDEKIVASAAVRPYLEINDSNIDSFHFHGETKDFPISSIIAVAPDKKSQTLLIGRYQACVDDAQAVIPESVVGQLMSMVFRVKQFFDANAILIAISTALLLLLVVLLSLKLRQREMDTMFKLGCSRGTILLLQVGEMAIVFLVSAVLVAFATGFVWQISGGLVQRLLLGQ